MWPMKWRDIDAVFVIVVVLTFVTFIIYEVAAWFGD